MIQEINLAEMVDDLVGGSTRGNLDRWTRGNVAMILLLMDGTVRKVAESQAQAWLESLPSFGVFPGLTRKLRKWARDEVSVIRKRQAPAPPPQTMTHRDDARGYLTECVLTEQPITSMARKTYSLGHYPGPGRLLKEVTMEDPDILVARFTYHPPRNIKQVQEYEAIREHGLELAQLINRLCPDSREKSLAFTKLEEAIMWANAAKARNA